MVHHKAFAPQRWAIGLALHLSVRALISLILAKDLRVRPTGVYILVGSSESSPSGHAVYIGESDDVWYRLTKHDNSKDFWDWVVIFVSKDDNLTKAHIRWLEATLIREINAAKRAEVMNSNEPVGGRLPEADTADMETFFENVRLLLPTLGVNVFAVESGASGKTVQKSALRLELKIDEVQAECVVVDGQFLLQPGSIARLVEGNSLGRGTRALRESLKSSGVLVPDGKLLRFSQEYAFDSPSGSAAVVVGNSINGRLAWKVKGTGETYKEWQESQVSTKSDDETETK